MKRVKQDEFKKDILKSLELIKISVGGNFKKLSENKDLDCWFEFLAGILRKIELREHIGNGKDDEYYFQNYSKKTFMILSGRKNEVKEFKIALKKYKFSIEKFKDMIDSYYSKLMSKLLKKRITKK